MKAYSMDLRVRVVAAREDGMGTSEVAEMFGCCRSWVRRLMQRRRERGTLDPVARRPPDRRALADDDRALLRARVAAQPDATLGELVAALRADAGKAVSESTVSRALSALGLPRKKSRSTPRSRTGRT